MTKKFFESSAFMRNGILRFVGIDADGNESDLALHDYNISPLGYEELHEARQNQPLTISLAISGAKIHPSSVNADLEPGRYTSDITINSTLTCAAYGLIEGGWMVPGIHAHRKCTYLLDRCAFKEVTLLTRKKDKGHRQNDFLGWLADPGASINYIPVVLEGRNRRRPTPFELPAEAFEVEDRLRKALPLAELRHTAEQAAVAASNLLSDPALSIQNETSFLNDVRHHLLHPTDHKRRQSVVWEVCQTADRHGVARLSFTCLAVLSAILCNPKDNPALKLLKVSQLNTPGGMHNAQSDLRALKMLAMMTSYQPEERPMFCTSDKNLAKFWVALNPRNMRMQGGRAAWEVSYNESWFPGIDEALLQ